MRIPILSPNRALTLGLFASLLVANSLRAEEWTDVQGKAFKADAVEALGPFALFSVSSTEGRCLPMQALPLADLARFSVAVKKHPPRAKDWAHATSPLTAQLRGHLEKVEQQKLVPWAVDDRPEPLIVVVLFLNKDAGDTWKLLWGSMEPIGKLANGLPGVVECIGYGVNYGPDGWRDAVKDAGAPWSLVKLADQPTVKVLDDFVPRSGYRAVAFNRDGVPLFGAIDPDEQAVKEFWSKVASFAALLDLGNPFSWRPLAYYQTAEKIAAHPAEQMAPELVGYAIRPGSLSRFNVHALEATLKISADGVVSDVTDLKSETPLPPKLHDALITTLKKAVFVPAIDHGKPVASEYGYHFRDEDAPAH